MFDDVLTQVKLYFTAISFLSHCKYWEYLYPTKERESLPTKRGDEIRIPSSWLTRLNGDDS
jgi:hypothetical protein